MKLEDNDILGDHFKVSKNTSRYVVKCYVLPYSRLGLGAA